MRIRIVFHLWNKGGHVPFHHQYMLSQIIKGVNLRGSDEKFRKFTDYNFSGLKGQTQVSRKGLHFFSNRVTLVFSCSNADFCEYFLDNLFDLEEFEIGTMKLSPEVVETEEPYVFTDNMKYVCISPVVIKDPLLHQLEIKSFIDPMEDQFSDLLYDSTMSRMEKAGVSRSKINSFYKFQVVPDESYLEKIKASNKKFARVYPMYESKTKYEVRGYTFPFSLYADKQVQEFIFTHGLGVLGDRGFGMLDIANSNPVKRNITRKSKSLLNV